MEQKRKRRNIIIAVLILALAAGMAALPALLKSAQPEAEDKASYLSAPVERRDIYSTISGGGTLTQEEGTAARVLRGVEVTEYLVKNGDWVEEGQPVALVDPVSVMQTIATLQENLDYLSRQLKRNPGRVSTDAIYLPAPGRVKAVYAEKGDRVSDVMAEHGCLAVISLDGLMALDIDTDFPVEAGRDVTVILSDGTEVTGRVEVCQGNHLTVTLPDNGPRMGDTAAVRGPGGEDMGSGTLYVHSAWNVTAISGEITYVAVKEERTLGMGGHLFNLKDVDFSQKNRELSEQRREYEEAMGKLFSVYRDGAVTAPAAGRVSGIDKERIGLVRAGEPEYQLVFLSDTEPAPEPEPEPPAAPDPNKDYASQYYNRAAVVGSVSFGAISFLVDRSSSATSSYAALPSLDYGNADAIYMTGFSGITIYGLDGNWIWNPISPSELCVGDLLYFVYKDAESTVPMWIMRPNPAPEPEPQPSYGGGGGGGGEEQFDMYELTETELFQIVPQNVMTVEVSIDELDILSVEVGQTAEITVDALPGRAFSGTVTEVDPIGKNSGGNTKYTITITIDRDDNMLQGMNATAILTVGVTKGVLTVPAAALTQKGSRSFVYTGFDPESRTLLAPAEVELGVSDGQTVEVLSGLEEGQIVWYSYYETEKLPAFLAGLPGETL